jgi:hypothetical protein
MRSQDRLGETDWLAAAHDHIGAIINDGLPARESKGQKKGPTLVELLAESTEALGFLMGDSAKDSELHEDFAGRARRLRRLFDENQSPRVQAMDARYKNAVLVLLDMEPHIPEMLALDDTLNFLSAGVWEISAAVYGQIEAAGLVIDRLQLADRLLGKAGVEDSFEVSLVRALEGADRLQERIQGLDLDAPISVPPPAHVREDVEDPEDAADDFETRPSEHARLDRDPSLVTLGDYLASKPGAPLAKIQSLIASASRAVDDDSSPSGDELAARTVQRLIDSLDILLDSLRG